MNSFSKKDIFQSLMTRDKTIIAVRQAVAEKLKISVIIMTVFLLLFAFFTLVHFDKGRHGASRFTHFEGCLLLFM